MVVVVINQSVDQLKSSDTINCETKTALTGNTYSFIQVELILQGD